HYRDPEVILSLGAHRHLLKLALPSMSVSTEISPTAIFLIDDPEVVRFLLICAHPSAVAASHISNLIVVEDVDQVLRNFVGSLKFESILGIDLYLVVLGHMPRHL
ncbi:hypothetical protein MPER_01121, partial [Moniliophthora perniciosa FA553]